MSKDVTRIIMRPEGAGLEVHFESRRRFWPWGWKKGRVVGTFDTLPQACKGLVSYGWQLIPHLSLSRQQRRAAARDTAKALVQ